MCDRAWSALLVRLIALTDAPTVDSLTEPVVAPHDRHVPESPLTGLAHQLLRVRINVTPGGCVNAILQGDRWRSLARYLPFEIYFKKIRGFPSQLAL